MMYMKEQTNTYNIWLQLKWKLKVHQGKLWALIIIQLACIIMFSSPNSGLFFDFSAIKGQFIVSSLDTYAIASAIYMLMFSMYIGQGESLKENLTIPTTRLLSTISNSLYLFVISFVTTIVSFSSLYMATIGQIIFQHSIIDSGQLFSLSHFIAFWLLIWFVSSIGYLLTSLSQIHLLVSVIAMVIVWFGITMMSPFFENIYEILIAGGVYAFSFKCFIGACVLYCLTALLTNRLEVK